MTRQFQYAALGLTILGSLALNLWNIDFPYGYHIDEPNKVEILKSGKHKFFHPLLMLEAARIANLALGFTEDQALVVLGRTINAFFGAGLVLLCYLVAKKIASATCALLTAIGAAVSPILVVHAHYFKEDILLTFGLMFTLLCFLRHREKPSSGRLLALGAATGLAFSAHYKGFLLVPFYGALPLILPENRDLKYLRNMAAVLAIASATFCLVNWPLFLDTDNFLSNVGFEWRHALTGHDVKIGPWSQLFTFHLRESLIPGMTILPLLLGLGYLIKGLIRWRRTIEPERLLILFVLLFYLIPEISPLKPFPDFMRYMIPIVPVWIYFSFRALEELTVWRLLAKIKIIPALVGILSLAEPANQTIRLDYHMGRDTRIRAQEWLAAAKEKTLYETFALPIAGPGMLWTAVGLDIEIERRRKGTAYLMVSSFSYDRFFFASRLEDQDPEVYKSHGFYEELFLCHPIQEIAPAYKTFAFSNPTIRIVDIRRRLRC